MTRKCTLSNTHNQGLTLIEMLVTLVLVAIISTVIMQGMGYIWSLQNRYNQVINQSSEQNMHLSWWRDSVARLVTLDSNDPSVFRGDGEQFEGQSLSAIGHEQGNLAGMRWQITTQSGQTELLGNGQVILNLPNGSEFAYLDNNWVQHDHWPLAESREYQLPAVIVIHIGNQVVWAASPLQPQVPKTPLGGAFGYVAAP